MNTAPSLILAIESSCDETGAAVYCSQRGLLSNVLFSQVATHSQFGGVVPEIASREHVKKIAPIVSSALEKAGITSSDITAIGVTSKPGLAGSLLVGVCFAKSLAWAWNKPLIGVDHLEGHVFSACIENNIPFPFLCLTVSGGHTSLYVVENLGVFTAIGTTVDDAAGEAFDKVSKLLGLGYPGGPIIEKLAHKAGFQDFFHYPRPFQKTLQFSFSGLKTAVLYDLVKRNAYDLPNKKFLAADDEQLKCQVASSLLVCMADTFKEKLALALEQYPAVRAVAFVGGVACNKFLRSQLSEWCAARNLACVSPSPILCTDNAGMIAFVAHYKAQQGLFSPLTLDIL